METPIHYIANIDDLELAMAAYEAACKRWPGEAITLREDHGLLRPPAFNDTNMTGLSAWMQSNPREDAELNTKNPCKKECAVLRADSPL